MVDYFAEKASEYDARPIPQQISEGVYGALSKAVNLTPDLTVMDFGAGTGLVATKIAPHVKSLLAVDISQAMLEQLAQKEALQGKVEIFCQNILEEPLDRQVDLVVSAMAMHHVDDTRALLQTLYNHLVPGGSVALADLDREKGDFHPHDVQGVFHHGFDRENLGKLMAEVGFADPRFVTTCELTKEERNYPVFLVTATKPA